MRIVAPLQRGHVRFCLPRPLAGILMLLVLGPLLFACDLIPAPTNPRPTATPAPSPTTTQPPRPTGGNLPVRLSSDPGVLNPWLSANDPSSQVAAGLMFNGLTRLDNRLQAQPDLAESWDVSEDGTTLTFHLREDVLWHDGRPFTADDVLWSYKALRSLPADNTALIHIQDTVRSVEAVEPISHTVRFTLNRRSSPLLTDLAMPILPSHILSGTEPSQLAWHPFSNAPVGTGPFRFESRRSGQSVRLVANTGYFGGQPNIDSVDLLVAPDPAVAEAAITDGRLLLSELPPLAAERLVTAGEGVRGGSYNELGFDFVAFNLREGRPFSDTRLRRAWALALDKPGFTFAAGAGTLDPVWTDVNKASWAYDPEVPRLGGSPDEARALLAEAGWSDSNADGIVEKDGKPLQVSLYYRADSEQRKAAAEAMVEPLRRAGIGVKPEAADFLTTLLARISPNSRPPFDFDVVLFGWTRHSPDPDSYALFHSVQVPTLASPNGLNIPGFRAPEYDALAVQARSTYDFEQRRELYVRMQRIIADQLPYYFLWSQKTGVVAGPSLKGDIDFASPRYMWNINQWWIEP